MKWNGMDFDPLWGYKILDIIVSVRTLLYFPFYDWIVKLRGKSKYDMSNNCHNLPKFSRGSMILLASSP